MILVIGSNGQLGRQMQRALKKRALDYVGCDFPDIDITQSFSVEKWIDNMKPTVIVNCAAYTNVDQAESYEETAYKVNAIGPKHLAEVCSLRDIELIHISTDYVFSGVAPLENSHPRAYIETDTCAPETAYGKTKLAGERFIQEIWQKHYILRTAWLYGDGNNFIRTMLKLAKTNSQLRVVNDQFGSPTSTVDLAEAICGLFNTGAWGLYHATCEGQCNWFEFAKKIFEIKKIDVEVIPVTSEEFVRPAKRPAWSVLENAALNRIKANGFRPWEVALREYLSEGALMQ